MIFYLYCYLQLFSCFLYLFMPVFRVALINRSIPCFSQLLYTTHALNIA